MSRPEDDDLPPCELCAAAEPPGCLLVALSSAWRVVRVVGHPGFPAFYRLIWNDHVAEMSDLSPSERHTCIDTLARLESEMHLMLKPRKMNLASFGNVVPHLHWHVVARFDWDSHFPQPLWAPPLRSIETTRLDALMGPLADLDRVLRRVLVGDTSEGVAS